MRLTEKVRLGREMRHSLGDRFLVVVRPSHPYLVAPPDFLIGGEGLLTAVFSPSANERRAPLLIRPRLVGARLALPENTRCILLSPRGFLGDTADQSSGQQSLRYDFDAVVAEESYRQLAEIAASNDVRMTRPSELEKVRLENAARSAIALSLSEIARSRDTESSKIFGGSIKSHLSAIAAPGLPLRKATRPTRAWWGPSRLRPFHRGDQILMWATSDAKGGGIALAIRTALLNEYQLDMGVPYVSSATTPMLFLDRTPSDLETLEALIRAASIAGLAIGPTGRPELIEEFIHLGDVAHERRLRRADLQKWLPAR